ncbi:MULTISPECIES: carbohydrate ABC transporter permease [Paenibacillus]|uniref:Sugar ABC transporter permease n=1 Tax=Paenibacillus baimaensis TaxID=2982185 RepID=A0ABT2UQ90_9BACL|nr:MULTISPECIES: sugar ABC transporter permease [unclassified Paenibacillus]MCU6795834.1 sugar ABC transporter permease [Paenibacillus sp. WQ 127069]OMF20649.1 sugar ABC transporter permease [Paenibacillus sp. FSL H7-0331]
MRTNRTFFTRDRKVGYTFLLPNMIGFLVFICFPVIASFLMSFTDWNGFGQIEFAGLSNYTRLWGDETFRISLMNSLIMTIVSVPATLFLAILAAVALNKGVKGVKLFRTAIFMPHITATIAVAVVWQLLYNPSMGPINGLLRSLGVEQPPMWLASTTWALPSVIIVSIWHSVGYYMVLYLAGLQGIPKDLYEAASLDGAGKTSQFRNITIPMLSPVIFFTVIIGIINSFKVFDMVYVLTKGGPGRSTHVLVYDIYYTAFQRYEYGYASAMAYVLFAIILVITWIQFKGQKKWVNY